MARHVPSQAGNETSEVFETLFVSFTFINSLFTTCKHDLSRACELHCTEPSMYTLGAYCSNCSMCWVLVGGPLAGAARLRRRAFRSDF